MQKEKKQRLLAEGALLLCGIIWGSGFVVMKSSLDSLPVNWLLALRFMLAALVLGLVRIRQLARLDKKTALYGAVCGILMYAAYLTQTIGLQYTTAGNNAFLTAVYVVLVPFFIWVYKKRSPGSRAVLAGVICLAGVGVIALQEGFTVNIGDAWTLLSGALYGVHILCVSEFTKKGVDVMQLTSIQFIVTALCATLAGALFEPFPKAEVLLMPETMFSLLYLGLACTLLALSLQNIGIRFAPPTNASLLMSTEAPFGFLFGILLLDEPFTLRFCAGALLIIGSIVLSELGGKPVAPGKVAPEKS